MTTAPSTPPTTVPVFHHVGIQTTDLDNAVAWYEDFFGGRRSWSLTEFTPLTESRLPGIRALTEVVVGNLRIHLFERDGDPAVPEQSRTQFQHVCVSVGDPAELASLRRRWFELYGSGRYAFALSEQATGIVNDHDGVQSFYALDVNGLEFEFTYVPRTAPTR